MKPFPFALDERLKGAGDTLPFSGHADEDSYSLGGHDFELPSGIDFDLVLTNAGEGILVTGMLRAHVVGVCDRCLDPAEMDISAEVDEYYLFEEPEDAAQDDDGSWFCAARIARVSARSAARTSTSMIAVTQRSSPSAAPPRIPSRCSHRSILAEARIHPHNSHVFLGISRASVV